MGRSDQPTGDPAGFRGGSSEIPALIEKIAFQPAGIRRNRKETAVIDRFPENGGRISAGWNQLESAESAVLSKNPAG